MARFLAGIFGGPAKKPPALALRVTTSLQGIPLPILLGGQNRLACSLIWYGNFQWQNASGSGKGGAGGGSSKGQSGSYTYSASFILAICEGPISGLLQYFLNGAGKPIAGSPFTVFDGTYSQTAWGYVEGFEPTEALPYRGVAYIGAENYPLGSSPSLPNFTWEVVSTNSGLAVAGVPDADPSTCWNAFLDNVYWGVGFPSARMAALNADSSSWSAYCIANQLLVSPVLPSQTAASSVLTDLLTATNSNACWQDGELTVRPYGDTAVQVGAVTDTSATEVIPAPFVTASGVTTNYCYIDLDVGGFVADLGVTNSAGSPFTKVNTSPKAGQYWMQTPGNYVFYESDQGTSIVISYSFAATASYVPDTQSIYAFTYDDMLPNQGTLGTGLQQGNSPLVVVRKSKDQIFTSIKLEYLDRNNNYNPVDIEIKDEASIVAFGRERPSDLKQMHMFCLGAAAQQSAALMLTRQMISRTFQWTVGAHFLMILQLMKICTVTDAGQGLNDQPVRITEIQENEDFSLTITAEEFLGTASAPLYGLQANSGFNAGFNTDPGLVNPPAFVELPEQLSGGLAVTIGISGSNPELYGGCQIWISSDGVDYSLLDTFAGATRMGVLTAPLPSVAVAPVTPTIDTTNTLSVDLAESDGQLLSVSSVAFGALATVSVVDSEIIAYENATLTSANNYNLTTLARGTYLSSIASHASGAPFMRLDGSAYEWQFTPDQIGQIFYFKFCAYNQYGGGLETLDDVVAYDYTPTGAALSDPLSPVSSIYSSFASGFLDVYWEEVTDPRGAPIYEIRKGASQAGSLLVRDQAHPPFVVSGPGTYWIAAKLTVATGLTVYSSTWESITISANQLGGSIIASYNEQSSDWPGTLQSGLSIVGSGGSATLELGASGSFTQNSPYYYTSAHVVNIGYVAQAQINYTLNSTGSPLGQNVLTMTNVLMVTDFLGTASAQFVSSWVEVNTATTETLGTPNWNGWQRIVPSALSAQWVQFREALESASAQVVAVSTAFSWSVAVPGRVDHYQGESCTSAGLTITFTPDGTATAAPFNAGPNGAALPYVNVASWAQATGEYFTITALSLSAMTIKFYNSSGTAISMTGINIDVEGV